MKMVPPSRDGRLLGGYVRRLPLLAGLLLVLSRPSPVSATEDPESSNVRLLSQVTLVEFEGGGTAANDIMGYVSPSGREYALVGLRSAIGFVDVTDPVRPRVLATFPHTESTWADIATYRHYAYLVHDLTSPGGDGIQVFDLARIDEGVIEQLPSSFSGGIQRAHNIRAHEETGFLYASGVNAGVGLWAFDLSDPAVPTFAGAWDDEDAAVVHDTHVLTVPEGAFAGRELAYSACGDASLRIVDVTDKTDMHALGGRVAYPNLTYCHQVWVDIERGYAFLNDELDELVVGNGLPTTTYVVNIQDPARPIFSRTFSNGGLAIDHNHWGRDGFLFQANYTSGLRIWDIRDLSAIEEVGYYDTHPDDGVLAFRGAWGVYTDLPSGNVIVSDIQGGLFVFDVSAAIGSKTSVDHDPGVGFAPNPFDTGTVLSLQLETPGSVRLEIFDAAGRWVATPVDHEYGAGGHILSWSPDRGLLPDGIYYARTTIDGRTHRVQRLVYLTSRD